MEDWNSLDSAKQGMIILYFIGAFVVIFLFYQASMNIQEALNSAR